MKGDGSTATLAASLDLSPAEGDYSKLLSILQANAPESDEKASTLAGHLFRTGSISLEALVQITKLQLAQATDSQDVRQVAATLKEKAKHLDIKEKAKQLDIKHHLAATAAERREAAAALQRDRHRMQRAGYDTWRADLAREAARRAVAPTPVIVNEAELQRAAAEARGRRHAREATPEAKLARQRVEAAAAAEMAKGSTAEAAAKDAAKAAHAAWLQVANAERATCAPTRTLSTVAAAHKAAAVATEAATAARQRAARATGEYAERLTRLPESKGRILANAVMPPAFVDGRVLPSSMTVEHAAAKAAGEVAPRALSAVMAEGAVALKAAEAAAAESEVAEKADAPSPSSTVKPVVRSPSWPALNRAYQMSTNSSRVHRLMVVTPPTAPHIHSPVWTPPNWTPGDKKAVSRALPKHGTWVEWRKGVDGLVGDTLAN